MLIKVCGIADERNAREVAELLPELMGFIFYRSSPRNAFGLRPEIVRVLPVGIGKVGVFVDEKEDTVLRIARQYGLTHIQLHGEESPQTCGTLRGQGFKVIKAFGISSGSDVDATAEYEGVCDLFVFDTETPMKGGSGRKFDHTVLRAYTGKIPFLLSGGISPEDANDPSLASHPLCAGVDINSRFETSPGLKNIDLLKEFMTSIKESYEQDR